MQNIRGRYIYAKIRDSCAWKIGASTPKALSAACALKGITPSIRYFHVPFCSRALSARNGVASNFCFVFFPELKRTELPLANADGLGNTRRRFLVAIQQNLGIVLDKWRFEKARISILVSIKRIGSPELKYPVRKYEYIF